jgi:hypothetical protein
MEMTIHPSAVSRTRSRRTASFPLSIGIGDEPESVDVEHETWEMYLAKDRIWAKAGSADGSLCVGCIERRLDASGLETSTSTMWVTTTPTSQTPRPRGTNAGSKPSVQSSRFEEYHQRPSEWPKTGVIPSITLPEELLVKLKPSGRPRKHR